MPRPATIFFVLHVERSCRNRSERATLHRRFSVFFLRRNSFFVPLAYLHSSSRARLFVIPGIWSRGHLESSFPFVLSLPFVDQNNSSTGPPVQLPPCIACFRMARAWRCNPQAWNAWASLNSPVKETLGERTNLPFRGFLSPPSPMLRLDLVVF